MATPPDLNITRLRRFLYLGDDCQMFPQSVTHPFSPEIVQCIHELLDSGLEEEAIKEIKRAYKSDHYLVYETVIYALVVIGHAEKSPKRMLAFEAAREICTTAEMVLTFTYLYREASKPAKGWGRAHRRFLIDWYNGKDAKDLAVEVTKVKTRYKWSHKDILCMAHIKPKNDATGAVLKYLVKGLEVAKKECESIEAEPVLTYLNSVYELTHTTDPQQAARLIEINDFCFQQIPPKILKSKEVSLSVIPRLPLKTLLELLPHFNRVGLLKPNSPQSSAVLERLGSEEALSDNSIGPLETFIAIRKWQISNTIVPGRSVMRQNNPAIEDALQHLHQTSFSAVQPTEKRYLIALDTNLTMNTSKCAGCNAVTPSHVSDILLMALVKAESTTVSTVVFSGEEVVPVEINNKMTLGDVVEHLSEIPAGPVDLASPINWALGKKSPFDTILLFTDRLTSTQDNNLTNVFKLYSETLHLPDVRYMICTLCDRTSSFNPEAPAFLNIVGFNVKLLKIIQDFSCGIF